MSIRRFLCQHGKVINIIVMKAHLFHITRDNTSCLIFFVLLFLVFLSSPFPLQSQSLFWSGDGGRGIRVTVSEPTGTGLSTQEQSLLPLIQSTIIGSFQKFSAMTVFDRQNLENIIREQQISMSGSFSDNDFIRIGHLTNARLFVFGSITKVTNNYTLELAVTDVETGERKASYLPRRVSLLELENLSAIREASADLLDQLGVNLTTNGLQELRRSEETARIQAENALAKGVTAQKQGTMVEALTYFFQAASFDRSLSEAISRVSIVSAEISGGNLGQAVLNRIQLHDEWRTIVDVANSFFLSHLPYEFVYDTDIKQANIDYTRRTAELAIGVSLVPTDAWKTINDLRQGLNTARRNEFWDFSLSRIEPEQILISMQIINENNTVLSTASHTFLNPSETNRTDAILSFPNVVPANITDKLIVRVISINGIDSHEAGETGYIQISDLSDYNRRVQEADRLRFEYAEAARDERLPIILREQEDRETNTARRRDDLEFSLSFFLGEGWKFINASAGLHWSPIPFTSLGLEARYGTSIFNRAYTSPSMILTASPTLGVIFPISNTVAVFADGLLDIGFFGPWFSEGMLMGWITPGFDLGVRLGNVTRLNWNIMYRGILFKDAITHSIGVGLNVVGLYR